jgi:hypothetical protein
LRASWRPRERGKGCRRERRSGGFYRRGEVAYLERAREELRGEKITARASSPARFLGGG